ncbi:RING-H2 finger protein ATL74-like [Phragmites australis]|uniref:RING-H2 finger protein ATL74-like n=1 Tax=Phragmites australis TaxID=29695 RepID=UPI002D789F82|nr:RING-H2 finger protein ATL74-like [Phragmites australis]
MLEVSHMSNCSNITTAAAPEAPSSPLDYDVVVILAAMLCALVCALGLNTMLQCVVRCTRRAVADPVGWVAHRRANVGLKREDVVALPVATYVASPSPARQQQQQQASGAGCAICLSDFSDGERIRVLPVCGHQFHVVCIDRWLVSHCSCPTCRRRLSSVSVGDGHHHLQILTVA